MVPGTSRSFDVIVVGGGPAGSATAISCRKYGLSTLILESDPVHRERPGETLHPGVIALFRSLGVDEKVHKAGFLRHPGHVVRWGDRQYFHGYGQDERGEWLGFQATRAEMDGILLQRAAELGAEIARPARAVDLIREGSQLAGVRTASGAYGSSFLVDAGGGAHWLHRRLGLPLWEVSGRLVTRYGWCANEGMDRKHAAPEFTVCGCGWRWRAQVKPGLDAKVALDLENSASGAAAAMRLPGSRDVTWRIARPCAGPGYYLAGDAAFVLDPASSHGVLKALMSGMVIAAAIARNLSGEADDKESQADYCAWMETAFCRDAAALIELYSRFDPAPSWLKSARDAIRYISMNPCS
jgi:flavin-dependent dehydrogenase